MLDINEVIQDDTTNQFDSEGYLADLPEWSEEVAGKLAMKEGISLTPDHWKVIRYLRKYYRDHGPSSSPREALCCLEDEFGDGNGRKWLYLLFPGGPVRQGSKIAGLPEFAYTVDPSFGSVH
jgi:tRNA 2-thiouridine synthesizing protein E